jgi:hypothetical protein
MLTYLYRYTEFEHLRRNMPAVGPRRTVPSRHHARIGLPLSTYIPGIGRAPEVSMGDDLADAQTQRRFLHWEARVVRWELLDLVCEKFDLPKTRRSYSALGTLNWSFGQKFTTADGEDYYATNSQYKAFGDSTRTERRDILHMRGCEYVNVTLPDGTRDRKQTALCCQAVCFLRMDGIANLLRLCDEMDLPAYLQPDLQNDSLILMLVRWFAPHPMAVERDEQYRPVCPGPLRLNHCLWQYAKATSYRRSLCNADGTPNRNFRDQPHVFGGTEQKRMKCFQDEKKAYYDVLSPQAIQGTAHMTREFSTSSMDISDSWLQTVTLI